ncbi:MAG TPA: hypothetical protein PLN21_00050 [Gemmatales bacterium]|nr:hypothetical protein [Gemmatales bacterium]
MKPRPVSVQFKKLTILEIQFNNSPGFRNTIEFVSAYGKDLTPLDTPFAAGLVFPPYPVVIGVQSR